MSKVLCQIICICHIFICNTIFKLIFQYYETNCIIAEYQSYLKKVVLYSDILLVVLVDTQNWGTPVRPQFFNYWVDRTFPVHVNLGMSDSISETTDFFLNFEYFTEPNFYKKINFQSVLYYNVSSLQQLPLGNFIDEKIRKWKDWSENN